MLIHAFTAQLEQAYSKNLIYGYKVFNPTRPTRAVFIIELYEETKPETIQKLTDHIFDKYKAFVFSRPEKPHTLAVEIDDEKQL